MPGLPCGLQGVTGGGERVYNWRQMSDVQIKERLTLIGEQGRACERAAQALQSLQTRHEDSAAAGAQALAQVHPFATASARG